MRPVIFIGLLFSCIFFSCKKSSERPVQMSDTGLIIKAGFECGWGAGTDSLEITSTAIRYIYYIPARSMTPIINKIRTVSDTEWTNILNDINIDDFLKLHYQSCNICVDGCDEWISVQNEKTFHQITFGKGALIDTISKLQNKLSALRSEFNH